MLRELGFLFIIAGTAFIAMSFLKTPDKTEIKAGGVLMIGPLPIIFGSDRETLIIAGVIGVIFTILTILLLFLGRTE